MKNLITTGLLSLSMSFSHDAEAQNAYRMTNYGFPDTAKYITPQTPRVMVIETDFNTHDTIVLIPVNPTERFSAKLYEERERGNGQEQFLKNAVVMFNGSDAYYLDSEDMNANGQQLSVRSEKYNAAKHGAFGRWVNESVITEPKKSKKKKKEMTPGG